MKIFLKPPLNFLYFCCNLQFCFVARKKFSHVSLLHVVHHGIMPLSVWPGLKFMPGGHASFFGLLNTFVHIFMYAYYMLSAMGPKYKKYVWWKQHMTTLQMVQFVGIMVHAFQLVTQSASTFQCLVSCLLLRSILNEFLNQETYLIFH